MLHATPQPKSSRAPRQRVKPARVAPLVIPPVHLNVEVKQDAIEHASEDGAVPYKRRPRRRGRRSGARGSRGCGGKLVASVTQHAEQSSQPDGCNSSSSDDGTQEPLVISEEDEAATFQPQIATAYETGQGLQAPQQQQINPETAQVLQATWWHHDSPIPVDPSTAHPTSHQPPSTIASRRNGHSATAATAISTESRTLPQPAARQTDWDPSIPRAYNSLYPHPLSVYASPSVNPASVAISGYAPLLEELKRSDPAALTGSIIAECERADLTAPALMLEPDSKDGCGIPEEYWLRLSSWAGVKVPLGVVVPLAHGRGCTGSSFLNNVSPGYTTPPLSSAGSTVPHEYPGRFPETPRTPFFSEHSSERHLSHLNSVCDLRAQCLSHTTSDHKTALEHITPDRGGPMSDTSLSQSRVLPTSLQHSPNQMQARLGSLTDEELMQELATTAAAIGISPAIAQQSVGRLSLSQPHSVMAFKTVQLSPVEETEVDKRRHLGTTIGAGQSPAPDIILPSPPTPLVNPFDAWQPKSAGHMPTHWPTAETDVFGPRRASDAGVGLRQVTDSFTRRFSADSEAGGSKWSTSPVIQASSQFSQQARQRSAEVACNQVLPDRGFPAFLQTPSHTPSRHASPNISQAPPSKTATASRPPLRQAYSSPSPYRKVGRPPFLKLPSYEHEEHRYKPECGLLPTNPWDKPSSTSFEFSTGKSIWS